MTLKQVVEESDTRGGRLFDFSIQALVVASLVAFSIETLPGLSLEARSFLQSFETASVAVFTIEYFLRLFVADRKLGFVFSFFGSVDALAIVPFYLSTGVDLRAVRIVRLLRLFRLLKLARYNNAIARLARAAAIAREELLVFGSVALLLLYLASVGIYFFEREAQPDEFASIFHSLWWAIITLTTVGYGDVYPITVGGRLFTFVVLALGLGVVAVPAGVVASAMSQARREMGRSESREQGKCSCYV